MNPRNPSWGALPIQGLPNQQGLVPKLASISDAGAEEGPNYRYGGMLTYETPIREWYGDIILPVGATSILKAGIDLPNNCVQVRFINVVGTPTVDFGNGPRQIINLDSYNNTEIKIMRLTLGAGDTCTVQAAGTGD